ncbi:hypothetical protein NFI96_008866 [Prochilodus magdalenae]|nr:hypothetical protein NFI96_008866 [Prochilodus magdalenae]
MDQGKRSDSPEPSCVSMKSDQSVGRDIYFRKETSPTEFREQTETSDSSKRNMELLFKELEHKVISLVKNQLKRFMKLLSLDYPACSKREVEDEEDHSVREETLRITLHVLRNMNQTDLANTLQSKLAPSLPQKLKSTLKEKCQKINEGISNPGTSKLLNEIYTELYITEGGSGEVNNEHESASVDVLLTNLIKGNLLPSALLWITTRPAAARSKIAPLTVLTRVNRGSKTQQPKVPKKKSDTDHEQTRKTILALGELAFHQLDKGNLIFYEEDLRECGIDVREVSVYSGVCTQIFREEFGLHLGKVFSFVHLSVQEFLAALYVFLSFISNNRNVLLQQDTEPTRTMSDFLKSAVDKALQSENGHLDLFLRFLLGLSLESNQTVLRDALTQTGNRSYNKEEIVEYIKKKIRENPSPEKTINLFHCLNELNDHSLVQEVQTYLNRGGSSGLSGAKLSPAQWSAVAFVMLNSEEELEEFDLSKFDRSEECLLRLLPVARVSRKVVVSGLSIKERGCAALLSTLKSNPSHLRELNMNCSDPEESGVKLLSDILEDPQCKLEKLHLFNCSITEEGCAALVSALKSNPSHLRELNLGCNKPAESGVKRLSDLLEDPHCKLEKLDLSFCSITEEGCAALVSALKSNPSHLRELDLGWNNPGESGVKRLSDLLEDPHCKLEKLELLEGHLRRSCPEKVEEGPSWASNSWPTGNDAGQVSDTEAGPGTAGEWAADPRVDSMADIDPDIKTQEEEGGVATRPDTVTRSVTAVGQECSEPESDGLGANADVGAGAVFAAVGSVLEEEDIGTDAVAEKNVFKAPSGKRKMKWTKPSDSKGKTQWVAGVRSEKQGEDTGLSAPDDSDGDLSDVKSQRSRRSAYTFDKIKYFLQRTKNMKGVVVEDYFPDRRLFIESVQAIMKNDGGEQFTVQEIYRLKKIVPKLKLGLQNDNEDGFKTT